MTKRQAWLTEINKPDLVNIYGIIAIKVLEEIVANSSDNCLDDSINVIEYLQIVEFLKTVKFF